ncbi:hypothetical protein H6G45_06325 [Synechocystis sp. FACHB-383]|uniref:hypothetical protein n=1 Tax=Synechocystis sp. FACHB-383 TaxID=2692864 RepID=UPI001681E335|nr:hypothetical protein [Synechocystis sp. FACHB-383]MBD2653108.1 hypothetical protein [Synechocystis sp. FACHB-383]
MGNSLDTIYKYTEFCVQKTSANLKGLDAKMQIFIGFSAVLIRLAADLSPWFRLSTCSLAFTVIVFCAVSLKGSNVGPMAHPSVLLEDKWFKQGEEVHKGYIVSSWVDALDDYDSVISRKQRNLLWIIGLFCAAIACYSIGVILG